MTDRKYLSSDVLLDGYKQRTAPADIPTRRAPVFVASESFYGPSAVDDPVCKLANDSLNRTLRESVDMQTVAQEVKRRRSTREIDIVTTNRLEEDLMDKQTEADVEKAKARMMKEIDRMAAKISLPRITLPNLPNSDMKLDLLRRLVTGLTAQELKTELVEFIDWADEVIKIIKDGGPDE